MNANTNGAVARIKDIFPHIEEAVISELLKEVRTEDDAINRLLTNPDQYVFKTASGKVVRPPRVNNGPRYNNGPRDNSQHRENNTQYKKGERTENTEKPRREYKGERRNEQKREKKEAPKVEETKPAAPPSVWATLIIPVEQKKPVVVEEKKPRTEAPTIAEKPAPVVAEPVVVPPVEETPIEAAKPVEVQVPTPVKEEVKPKKEEVKEKVVLRLPARIANLKILYRKFGIFSANRPGAKSVENKNKAAASTTAAPAKPAQAQPAPVQIAAVPSKPVQAQPTVAPVQPQVPGQIPQGNFIQFMPFPQPVDGQAPNQPNQPPHMMYPPNYPPMMGPIPQGHGFNHPAGFQPYYYGVPYPPGFVQMSPADAQKYYAMNNAQNKQRGPSPAKPAPVEAAQPQQVAQTNPHQFPKLNPYTREQTAYVDAVEGNNTQFI